MTSPSTDRTYRKYEHLEKTQKINLGWIGMFFGSQQEKPGNIAAIVVTASILCLIGLPFTPLNEDMLSAAFTGLLSLLTLTLGYLFGKSK